MESHKWFSWLPPNATINIHGGCSGSLRYINASVKSRDLEFSTNIIASQIWWTSLKFMPTTACLLKSYLMLPTLYYSRSTTTAQSILRQPLQCTYWVANQQDSHCHCEFGTYEVRAVKVEYPLSLLQNL